MGLGYGGEADRGMGVPTRTADPPNTNNSKVSGHPYPCQSHHLPPAIYIYPSRAWGVGFREIPRYDMTGLAMIGSTAYRLLVEIREKVGNAARDD